MELKIGDKVRVISYEEALNVYYYNDAINFDVFKRDGGKIAYVFGMSYNSRVITLTNGSRYKPTSLKKINSFDIKLAENLFEI